MSKLTEKVDRLVQMCRPGSQGHHEWSQIAEIVRKADEPAAGST